MRQERKKDTQEVSDTYFQVEYISDARAKAGFIIWVFCDKEYVEIKIKRYLWRYQASLIYLL